MKTTKNRKLILRLLDDNFEDCGGCPPYSASSLHYMLHDMNMAGWYAKQDGIDPPKCKPPSIQQIHRTLKDLANAGLIVCKYRLNEACGVGSLPQRVAYWQLAERVEYNAMVNACNQVYNKTKRAKFGINLFGATFDQGLPADEVLALKTEIKSLMQRTHPDKATGFDEQFKLLQEALTWIKDGIDSPGADAREPPGINSRTSVGFQNSNKAKEYL